MIVEIAHLEAKPGDADAMREGLAKGRAVLARSKGYRESAFLQSIEKPERFVLYVTWDTVEDHLDARKAAHFAEWRSCWVDHMVGTPDVLHYHTFAGEG